MFLKIKKDEDKKEREKGEKKEGKSDHISSYLTKSPFAKNSVLAKRILCDRLPKKNDKQRIKDWHEYILIQNNKSCCPI